MELDVDKVNARISEATQLLDDANLLIKEKVIGSAKLANRIKSEIKFLKKILNRKVVYHQSHLSSTNLGSLQSLIDAIKRVGHINITSLLHTVSYETEFERLSLCVDIVANNGNVWIKSIARNAKALHHAWSGQGQYGEKNLIDCANDFLSLAEKYPVDFHPPKIIFSFSSGVPTELAEELSDLGISIEGEIVSGYENYEYSSDEEGKEDDAKLPIKTVNLEDLSTMLQTPFFAKSESNRTVSSSNTDQTTINDKVNLDVTTLLSLVSNLCNGENQWIYGYTVIDEQAREERNGCRVLPILNEYLKDKELLCCETAMQHFKEIVSTIGGPNETMRTEELIKRIVVVPDAISERTLNLISSSKMNKRSKTIFGTGDTHQAVTVTANTGFIRAAKQNGVQYSVFVHFARALTELKEKKAKLVLKEICNTTDDLNQIDSLSIS